MIIEHPIVLLVDDSPDDAFLMHAAFKRAGFEEPLQFVQGGEEAIAYLRGEGAYSDRKRFPIPTIVLLDLNMPGTNGFEVLEWIRQQPMLKLLRVYILSTSSREKDIQQSYELGANSYLVKPGNLDALMHMARTLVEWLKLSHFAPVGASEENQEFTMDRAVSSQREHAHMQMSR